MNRESKNRESANRSVGILVGIQGYHERIVGVGDRKLVPRGRHPRKSIGRGDPLIQGNPGGRHIGVPQRNISSNLLDVDLYVIIILAIFQATIKLFVSFCSLVDVDSHLFYPMLKILRGRNGKLLCSACG